MSTLKRDKCWDSSRKEMKYLETQTDLLVSTLSSLASARQRQILSFVTKKSSITAEKTEFDTFFHSNNCADTLKRMNGTVQVIERELVAFRTCTEKDNLIADAIGGMIGNILNNCKVHLESCKEAYEAVRREPLLSEDLAKSLLAIVIHRPHLFENQKRFVPDIESLLIIK